MGRKSNRFSGTMPPLPNLPAGHKPLVSRRELLGHGLVAGVSSFFVPSLVSAATLGRDLNQSAQSCAPSVDTNRIPFLTFDCAGGWNIAGEFMPRDRDGHNLPGYGNQGHGDALMDPNLAGNAPETGLGLPMFKNSPFLAGLRSKVSAATFSKMRAFGFFTPCNDDTDQDPLNCGYLVARSGTTGLLTTLFGTSNTVSGGTQALSTDSFDPKFTKTLLSTPAQVAGLVQYGSLSNLLGAKGADRLAATVAGLSSAQLQKFNSMDLTTQVKTLVECQFLDVNRLTQMDISKVDPMLDPRINSMATPNGPFGFIRPYVNSGYNSLEPQSLLPYTNSNLSGDDEVRAVASAAKMLANKYAGVGTVVLGGCDYHDDLSAQWVARNNSIGVLAGAYFEYFANTPGAGPAVLYLCSDGATSHDATKDPITAKYVGADGNLTSNKFNVCKSDGGPRAFSVMLVFNPNEDTKPVALDAKSKDGFRVGYYFYDKPTNPNNTGSQKLAMFDDGSPILSSNSLDALSHAVLLNYLALHGEEGRFSNLVSKSVLVPADYKRYIKVNKIV